MFYPQLGSDAPPLIENTVRFPPGFQSDLLEFRHSFEPAVPEDFIEMHEPSSSGLDINDREGVRVDLPNRDDGIYDCVVNIITGLRTPRIPYRRGIMSRADGIST